jgi:hypothetical protein
MKVDAINNFKMKVLLLLVITGFIRMVHADEQLLSCEKDVYVIYSDPSVIPLKDRIIVHKINKDHLTVKKELLQEFKIYSPQRISAFNRLEVADTSKPGPWNNTIQLFTVQGPRYAWQMELRNVMDNASIEWLNEDLIFIRAWWGRIVSTDLIFQVSTGQFIYSQEANYGNMVQPCK